MSRENVYLCPACQAVLKSAKGSATALICNDCGFEFGGGRGVEPAKLPRVDITIPTRYDTGTSTTTVVRDLMKQRAGQKNNLEIRDAFSVHEMALGEGTPIEHDSLPPGEDEIVLKDGSRMRRRKKRKKEKDKHRKLYFFLTSWLGIAAAIIAVIQIKGDPNDNSNENRDAPSAVERRNYMFFNEHSVALRSNFERFIRASEDADRLQEIDYSSRLASDFTKFHQGQSLPRAKGRLSLLKQNIITLEKDPFSPAVELEWFDEDRKRFESVHLWDGEAWKLDWEHFVRYSTTPWTLFKANIGEKEGEFRLLVRKRRTLDDSDFIRLLFYEEPQAGLGDIAKLRQASESPEIILKSRSDLAKQMMALFQEHENSKRPYDSILGDTDPSLMMRITVTLAWEEKDKDEIMVIKDISGVSWYGNRVRRAYRNQQDSLEEIDEDQKLSQAGDT